MKFILENFRPFHEEAEVEIAPLTILLGENSSGKTSFLAGFRYIVQSMSDNIDGSFNREPFFLGAYDQIAHYRGGRAGRSANFTLGLALKEEELGQFTRMRRRLHPGPFGFPRQELTEAGARLVFTNDQSQPALDKLLLDNRYVSFTIERNQLPRFMITKLSSGDTEQVPPPERQRVLSPVSIASSRNSIAPFYSAIQNWIYSKTLAVDKPKSKDASGEMELVKLATRADLLINVFSEQSMYTSAPFRTKPERTYSPIEPSSSAEGSHIPILLAQAKAFEKSKWPNVKGALEAFGQESGMFKKIDIKRLGNSTSDPFQLIISVSQDRSNIIDVGYGISQILPLIVETLLNDDADFFIFQQPEVHLHPRAQAELGSYFTNFAMKKNKYLLLETHSDYIIERIRSELISKKLDLSKYLSVLFFEREKLDTKVTRIMYDDKGNVISAPDNYRSFFISESLRTYGV